MAIFMKYGSITGAVTEQGHKNWIELTSFQWGVGRGITQAHGTGTTREASNPSISEITATKPQDASSPNLWLDAVAGQLNNLVTIEFTTTTKNKTETYLKYELTNTGLSGYSISSGGDRPSESISLNFSKVSWTFTPTGSDTSGTPQTVGYDLSLMQTT
ncbi:MAG TPA: type VI secretion system tube protein Hcp [Acetobacteraceae bacterium]|nr:type VI secretion system tube protein Hcp [Acetobacteraceae bacterium]